MTREQYNKLCNWQSDNCMKLGKCSDCPLLNMEFCGYKEDWCLKQEFTDEMRALVGETELDTNMDKLRTASTDLLDAIAYALKFSQIINAYNKHKSAKIEDLLAQKLKLENEIDELYEQRNSLEQAISNKIDDKVTERRSVIAKLSELGVEDK